MLQEHIKMTLIQEPQLLDPLLQNSLNNLPRAIKWLQLNNRQKLGIISISNFSPNNNNPNNCLVIKLHMELHKQAILHSNTKLALNIRSLTLELAANNTGCKPKEQVDQDLVNSVELKEGMVKLHKIILGPIIRVNQHKSSNFSPGSMVMLANLVTPQTLME